MLNSVEQAPVLASSNDKKIVLAASAGESIMEFGNQRLNSLSSVNRHDQQQHIQNHLITAQDHVVK